MHRWGIKGGTCILLRLGYVWILLGVCVYLGIRHEWGIWGGVDWEGLGVMGHWGGVDQVLGMIGHLGGVYQGLGTMGHCAGVCQP